MGGPTLLLGCRVGSQALSELETALLPGLCAARQRQETPCVVLQLLLVLPSSALLDVRMLSCHLVLLLLQSQAPQLAVSEAHNCNSATGCTSDRRWMATSRCSAGRLLEGRRSGHSTRLTA